MFGKFIDLGATLFGTSKDELIASALKPAIEHYLEETGSTREIQVDTVAKTAKITLDIRGEDRPVIIQVARYSIEPDPKGCALVVHDFSCPSHQWIATVAKKFSPAIKIPLPVPLRLVAEILG